MHEGKTDYEKILLIFLKLKSSSSRWRCINNKPSVLCYHRTWLWSPSLTPARNCTVRLSLQTNLDIISVKIECSSFLFLYVVYKWCPVVGTDLLLHSHYEQHSNGRHKATSSRPQLLCDGRHRLQKKKSCSLFFQWRSINQSYVFVSPVPFHLPSAS